MMNRTYRTTIKLSCLIALSLFLIIPKGFALSGGEFQSGRIIDDAKFFSGPTMSVSDIQIFLNAKVPTCDTWGTQMHSSGQTRAQYSAAHGVSTPFTCLKDYHTSIPEKSAEPGLCNGLIASGASAAEIISWVAQSCGINPQVLIVLIQKEQSLITDDWPWPVQYRSATGYGCPDSAPCDTEYYGFFNQVYNAARQFKRYARDSNLFNFKAGMNANIQYNPNAACGSSVVYIQNQATAGLYNYTPYQPNAAALNNLYGTGDGCSAYGNRNFWRLFNDWFGSTFGPPDYSCKNSVNVNGAPTGGKVIPNQFTPTGYDTFSLILPNNTGSACIEAHTWQPNLIYWYTNVATNHPAVNPADGKILSADVYGDNKDELIFVKYRNTGSGNIEIHVWDNTYQRWAYNIATNHPAIDPADGEVIAGDMNGDGRDELMLVKYRNTGSGNIEVHTWTPDKQGWVSNIATNHPAVNPADARVIAANLYGDNRDEIVLVKYRNTGSGNIEVHTWGTNQQYWLSNVATNHPAADPNDVEIMGANIFGTDADELVLVKYRNTGSGNIEVHTWGTNQQYWLSHAVTGYGSL